VVARVSILGSALKDELEGEDENECGDAGKEDDGCDLQLLELLLDDERERDEGEQEHVARLGGEEVSRIRVVGPNQLRCETPRNIGENDKVDHHEAETKNGDRRADPKNA